MAIANSPIHTPPDSYESVGDIMDLASKHPQLHEGVSVLEPPIAAPEYDTGVETVETQWLPKIHSRYGKFLMQSLTMDDGTRYEKVIGLPDEPLPNAVALYTTAWFTDHRAGYNIETAIDAMKHGFTPVIQSSELNASIPMSHSAHNMHQSFGVDPQLDSYHPDEAIIVLFGDSQAAGIGFGFAAEAAKHKRNVVDGLLVDPPGAEPISARELLQRPSDLLVEGYSLARQLGRLNKNQLPHYVKTVRPSVRFLMRQILMRPRLFDGEAGQLGRRVPSDQPLDLILFSASVANHAEEWREIFADTQVNIEEREGSHMSIARPDTRAAKIDKLETVAHQLKDGQAPPIKRIGKLAIA